MGFNLCWYIRKILKMSQIKVEDRIRAYYYGTQSVLSFFEDMSNVDNQGAKFSWSNFEELAVRRARSGLWLNSGVKEYIWEKHKEALMDMAEESARRVAKALVLAIEGIK